MQQSLQTLQAHLPSLQHSFLQLLSLLSQQPPVKHEGAETAFADVRMQAYCDQMSAFIDGIEGRPNKAGIGPDGRAAVEACVAMLESSASKCWIFPGQRAAQLPTARR